VHKKWVYIRYIFKWSDLRISSSDMVANFILCTFVLFLGFLNNHQFLAKKTDWQDGKKITNEIQCLRENMEETMGKAAG